MGQGVGEEGESSGCSIYKEYSEYALRNKHCSLPFKTLGNSFRPQKLTSSEVNAQCEERNHSRDSWSFPGADGPNAALIPSLLAVVCLFGSFQGTDPDPGPPPCTAPGARCVPKFRMVQIFKGTGGHRHAIAVFPGKPGGRPRHQTQVLL